MNPKSRKWIAIVALGALVAGAVGFVVTRPGKAPVTGQAGASLEGGDSPEAALWNKLARLGSWLPTFEQALKNPEPEAKTVLAAFATLADKVGGPSGFWREQVPNELLRCDKEPDQAVCRRLADALPELTDGESLARQIGRLDPSRAEVYLSRNAEQMLAWVIEFVPTDATAEAMRRTSFWEQKLAPAVAGSSEK